MVSPSMVTVAGNSVYSNSGRHSREVSANVRASAFNVRQLLADMVISTSSRRSGSKISPSPPMLTGSTGASKSEGLDSLLLPPPPQPVNTARAPSRTTAFPGNPSVPIFIVLSPHQAELAGFLSDGRVLSGGLKTVCKTVLQRNGKADRRHITDRSTACDKTEAIVPAYRQRCSACEIRDPRQGTHTPPESHHCDAAH